MKAGPAMSGVRGADAVLRRHRRVHSHCGWKILHREGELFENGVHVKDDRLAGGARRVDSEVHER